MGNKGAETYTAGGLECNADLDMVEPVGGLKRGVPSLVIHIRVADILQLAQTGQIGSG